MVTCRAFCFESASLLAKTETPLQPITRSPLRKPMPQFDRRQDEAHTF